jgi:hypothetical protein
MLMSDGVSDLEVVGCTAHASEKNPAKGPGRPLGDTWKWIKMLPKKNENNKKERLRGECSFCKEELESRGSTFERHLLHCRKALDECKQEIQGVVAKRIAPTQLSGLPKRQRRQTTLPSHYDSAPVSKTQAHEYDTLLLRAIAISGLPFSLADNPAFLDLLKKLRPAYQPAGR